LKWKFTLLDLEAKSVEVRLLLEVMIIENFLLFSWASSQPQTRPQGAAKMLWVRTRSVDCNGWMMQFVYIEIVRVIDNCLDPLVVEGFKSDWSFGSFRP
jgi:hypothetical protein